LLELKKKTRRVEGNKQKSDLVSEKYQSKFLLKTMENKNSNKISPPEDSDSFCRELEKCGINIKNLPIIEENVNNSSIKERKDNKRRSFKAK